MRDKIYGTIPSVFHRYFFMSKRWTIFLGTLVVILLGWFYHLNQITTLQSLILSNKKEGVETPTYVGEDMYTIAFNKAGVREYALTAPKVTYFQQSEKALFQQPQLVLFRNNAGEMLPTWRITAQSAVLNKQEQLSLDENVKILNLQPEFVVKTLTTAKAFVNIKTGDYYSPLPTTVTGPQLISNGQSMSGNFNQQLITLENQVDTHYEFKQP